MDRLLRQHLLCQRLGRLRQAAVGQPSSTETVFVAAPLIGSPSPMLALSSSVIASSVFATPTTPLAAPPRSWSCRPRSFCAAFCSCRSARLRAYPHYGLLANRARQEKLPAPASSWPSWPRRLCCPRWQGWPRIRVCHPLRPLAAPTVLVSSGASALDSYRSEGSHHEPVPWRFRRWPTATMFTARACPHGADGRRVYPPPGSPFVSHAARSQPPPPCLPRALSSLLPCRCSHSLSAAVSPLAEGVRLDRIPIASLVQGAAVPFNRINPSCGERTGEHSHCSLAARIKSLALGSHND